MGYDLAGGVVSFPLLWNGEEGDRVVRTNDGDRIVDDGDINNVASRGVRDLKDETGPRGAFNEADTALSELGSAKGLPLLKVYASHVGVMPTVRPCW